jgi:hypothetical protein
VLPRLFIDTTCANAGAKCRILHRRGSAPSRWARATASGDAAQEFRKRHALQLGDRECRRRARFNSESESNQGRPHRNCRQARTTPIATELSAAGCNAAANMPAWSTVSENSSQQTPIDRRAARERSADATTYHTEHTRGQRLRRLHGFGGGSAAHGRNVPRRSRIADSANSAGMPSSRTTQVRSPSRGSREKSPSRQADRTTAPNLISWRRAGPNPGPSARRARSPQISNTSRAGPRIALPRPLEHDEKTSPTCHVLAGTRAPESAMTFIAVAEDREKSAQLGVRLDPRDGGEEAQARRQPSRRAPEMKAHLKRRRRRGSSDTEPRMASAQPS